MKAVIPTIGSRGDVQPFIALAQGLARAGHTVRLASHFGEQISAENGIDNAVCLTEETFG